MSEIKEWWKKIFKKGSCQETTAKFTLLDQGKTENNQIKLNPLTPGDYGEYNEILKNVFVGKEHKDDHNIAITADYGEGKSSAINSFLNKNKKIRKKTITVSLAKYNYKYKGDDTTTNKNNSYSIYDHSQLIENKIEVQIINQILYQIKSRNIYLSKYKVKKNLFWFWKLLLWIFVAFLIFGIYNLIFFAGQNINKWSDLKEEQYSLWLRWFAVVIIPFWIFSFFFVFYQGWQKISNVIFNIFGTKIEASHPENNSFNLSVWDQEWREIIYIIRHSKKNYIIFEDLDRLENYEILGKLKDLCLTLSNQKRNKIKFIYVLSDQIFDKEIDKTKFFDLIIPIISVSNYESRILILYSCFSLYDFKPRDEIVQMTSKHIFDIRLIKHIVNEYNIFLNLNKKFLINEKHNSETFDILFSLIILKNIFINEFVKFKNSLDLQELSLNNGHPKNKTILFESLKEILVKNQEKLYSNGLISKNIFSFLEENEINYLYFIANKSDQNYYKFFKHKFHNVSFLISFINKQNYSDHYLKLLNLSILEYLILSWEKNHIILSEIIKWLFNENSSDLESEKRTLFDQLILNSNLMSTKLTSFLLECVDQKVLDKLKKWLENNKFERHKNFNKDFLLIKIHNKLSRQK